MLEALSLNQGPFECAVEQKPFLICLTFIATGPFWHCYDLAHGPQRGEERDKVIENKGFYWSKKKKKLNK